MIRDEAANRPYRICLTSPALRSSWDGGAVLYYLPQLRVLMPAGA